MSETIASFQTTVPRLLRILEKATLSDGVQYKHALLEFHPDELSIISSVQGSSTTSYTSVSAEFLDELDAVDDGVQVLLKLEKFTNRLDFVNLSEKSEDRVLVEFVGDDPDDLPTECFIKGNLTSRHYLTASSAILDQMPDWVTDWYDDDDRYGNPEEDKWLPTYIYTDTGTVSKIVQAVGDDLDTGIDHYPVVVEDGTFKLYAGSENDRDAIWGDLPGEVDGPDVANTYSTGFASIFSALDGDIRLNTAPGESGAPLSVVKSPFDGVTHRHAISPTGNVER